MIPKPQINIRKTHSTHFAYNMKDQNIQVKLNIKYTNKTNKNAIFRSKHNIEHKMMGVKALNGYHINLECTLTRTHMWPTIFAHH